MKRVSGKSCLQNFCNCSVCCMQGEYDYILFRKMGRGRISEKDGEGE